MVIGFDSSFVGRAGNTTAAILLSIALAKKGYKVCLTHLSSYSKSFNSFMGIEGYADTTCSPTQVANLLREGAIQPADMENYCIRLIENLDIFSNHTSTFSEEDMEIVQGYILDYMPHDFVIVDINKDVGDKLYEMAKMKMDVVFVNLAQSKNVLEKYAEYLKEVQLMQATKEKKDIKKRPQRRTYVKSKRTQKKYYICNQYLPEAGSLREFAKSIGAKINICLPVHHSYVVLKQGNAGKLKSVLTLAKEMPLPDIYADFERIASTAIKDRKELSSKNDM